MVSALGFKSDDPGSSPGQGKALRRVAEKKKKKMQAPLLGLAKSIYYLSFGQVFFQEGKRENVWTDFVRKILHIEMAHLISSYKFTEMC